MLWAHCSTISVEGKNEEGMEEGRRREKEERVEEGVVKGKEQR